ncbi:NAD-dependent epimerase/dehydratase family protein [Vagococcus sp. BWB3-3]|uniref:NAD-dependent epimerase/dehydratase family protein n=1 Tax=Vagococcus allomyrinae TaxID=2794353 RepID=A0A940P915_9ENTE|nr:NAD-dependent epimerase/dehydratase family protein [Vagococcus allomyrinae]MBP1043567.1 NAD-dependent epimerase/dehydratase family protein [Vagococcus allomyrinae]
MRKIVLLGGNGYIGRAVTEEWINRDNEVVFYVVSRSGKNKLQHSQIKNVRADVTNYESVKKVFPNDADCIVDFVGRPEKDPDELVRINRLPAEVMLSLSEEFGVAKIGFIGGTLGPKSFVKMKADILLLLKSSGKKVAYVEPTLVYGKDRNDSMAKMVPLLKFFGIFMKSVRPIRVENLAKELVDKLIS